MKSFFKSFQNLFLWIQNVSFTSPNEWQSACVNMKVGLFNHTAAYPLSHAEVKPVPNWWVSCTWFAKQKCKMRFKQTTSWANLLPVSTYWRQKRYTRSKRNMFEVWRCCRGWCRPSRWAEPDWGGGGMASLGQVLQTSMNAWRSSKGQKGFSSWRRFLSLGFRVKPPPKQLYLFRFL